MAAKTASDPAPEICAIDWPDGWPDGAYSASCVHGDWLNTPPPAPAS